MVIRGSSAMRRLSRKLRATSSTASSNGTSIRCLSSTASNSSSTHQESGANNLRNFWMAAAGASLAIAGGTAAAASSNTSSNTTKCDQYYGNLPSFGSSSDPMAGSSDPSVEEGHERVRISIIPQPNRSQKQLDDLQQRRDELQDLLDQNILSTSSIIKETDPSFVSTKKMYFYRTNQIESKKKSKFILMSGPSSETLGKDIAHLLGWDLNKMDVGKFADGETRAEVGESVRGKHVYLICSTQSNDAVMELSMMLSALRRSSAKSITAIIPYFGYSRQDQQFRSEAIGAKDVATVSV